ncbi:MAG: FeoB-associated Cys-rich membrane protein [Lachnospiraceae bacterium]|nr:FeoB-associated Cys-rich membrane protein [Lachnospiraceae bacterium]
MGLVDGIVLLLICAASVGILAYMRRQKRKGKSCCGCAGCSGGCRQETPQKEGIECR